MLPANRSRGALEIKTTYYILAVPGWVKYLSGFAILGLLVLIPINFLRLRIASSLSIFDDHLWIINKRLKLTIPFALIKRVFVNDLVNYKGESVSKLQIAINYEQDKTLVFFLANYMDSDDLMEALSRIGPDKFNFFDKKLSVVDDTI